MRVGARQDLVNRRVTEFAGGSVDPVVDEWATAHADLHWANLTGPQCEILGWEGWGAGPRGLDSATLWGYSLAVPEVAEVIEREFADDLATRSGKIAQLFTCVELLRMVVQVQHLTRSAVRPKAAGTGDLGAVYFECRGVQEFVEVPRAVRAYGDAIRAGEFVGQPESRLAAGRLLRW